MDKMRDTIRPYMKTTDGIANDIEENWKLGDKDFEYWKKFWVRRSLNRNFYSTWGEILVQLSVLLNTKSITSTINKEAK